MAEKTRPDALAAIVGHTEGVWVLTEALWGPNAQPVIIDGPPGVGRATAARLVPEAAKANPRSPFGRVLNLWEWMAEEGRSLLQDRGRPR